MARARKGVGAAAIVSIDADGHPDLKRPVATQDAA
jgi:hypothetical protein